ncbi:MAG: carbohydrate kinase family protein, partial [Candidatus Cloacimonetes bacterium]|nr:carbohydrate kinase family protein [Candidatus Cloacimonadota bacterium]
RLEMTGAGDAFSAGFLASLTLGENVSEAMRWGNANSASVIQKIGSQEGLLNREQLGKMLKKV